MRYLILFSVCVLPLAGCAAMPDCSHPTVTSSVIPLTATADHTAKPPGNQVHFGPQVIDNYPAGCAVPALVPVIDDAIWTSSDPINVQISNAVDSTNGLATCVGATVGAVTITAKSPATGNPLFGTASLTCQ
jgi:hypothetical protein